MYATIRRYEGATDPSETGRRVNEGFVPIISQIPGFVALYLVDAGGWRDDFDQRLSRSIRRRRVKQEGCGVCTAESGPVASKAAPDHRWKSCRLQSEVGYGSAQVCCRDLVKIALTVPSGYPVLFAIFRAPIPACLFSKSTFWTVSSGSAGLPSTLPLARATLSPAMVVP
jgi:hypothetical protein